MSIDERIDVIGRHPFRARLHLRGRERAIVQRHGMSAVRGHAADLFGTWVRAGIERELAAAA